MAAGGEAARHTASAVRNTIAQSLSPFCSDWDPGPWCGVTPLQLTCLEVCLMDDSKSSQVGIQFQHRAHAVQLRDATNTGMG